MTTEQKEIAATILQQLGGNKFIMMTGATNFTTDGNNIGFRFKGSKKANYCKITLNVWDTYTMEFAKIHSPNVHWHSKHDMVYDDMLQDIFTEVTGLYTYL